MVRSQRGLSVLLDTHVLLWWLGDDPRLGDETRDLISEGRNAVYVSAASVMEIAIKEAIGKLRVPRGLVEEIDRSGFLSLSFTREHAFALRALALHHRDPFDRMLIAQARVEAIPIVTRDGAFDRYEVAVLRA